MPSHDTKSSPADGVSRRSVIRGAATAGAAGLAATALGGVLSPAAAAGTRAASATGARPGGDVKAPAEPIVVHVRNAKSGDIEVFSGTSQTRPAGFPNGRRVTDDVVAIELRAIAGVTYPLIDSKFKPDAAAGLLTDGLTPADVSASPLGQFPYLGLPYSGYNEPS